MLEWQGNGIPESWTQAQQLVALIRADFSDLESPLVGTCVSHLGSCLEADGICSEGPDGSLS